MLIGLLHASGALRSFERTTLDTRFQYLNRPGDVDTSIALVAIDDASIGFTRRELEVGWPWPREYYGLLVDYFDQGGAQSVIFDILFSEPDIPRAAVPAGPSDQRFATAIEAAGNVALAVQLTSTDTSTAPIKRKHGLDPSAVDRGHLPSYRGALAPLQMFQEGAGALGGVNVEADGDGVVRRLPLWYRVRDSLVIPNLGAAGLVSSSSDGQGIGTIGDLPLDPTGSFLLFWYGPGGPNGAFEDEYISIRSLIVSAARLQTGQEPIVPPERFEGKTVIVGGIASGLYDHHATPVGGQGDYPGMEIFATFLSNVSQGHFLRDATRGWTYLFVMIMAVLGAGLVALHTDGVAKAGATMIGIALLYGLVAGAGFYLARWWLPLVAPTLALVTGFSLTSAVRYAIEGRKRRELRNVFQRYVSPQVVDEVAQNPTSVSLGGEEVEGTVFFSDIKGFTTIAEQLSPREVVQRLNEYFGVTTDVILKHRAMVDKYIGDAIMAVFGAPVNYSDHAAQACLAALEVKRALNEFYEHEVEDSPRTFRSRIGIHTGRIVVGNVGTQERVDYTAIGDAVNVAARLEQANKQYGTCILISQATYEQAHDAVAVREIDLLRLTGKEAPTRVYEVLAPKATLTEKDKRICNLFEEGLAAYRTQRWMRARQCFAAVLEIAPDDGPAALYQQRVEERAGETLPATWKGAHEMDVGK